MRTRPRLSPSIRHHVQPRDILFSIIASLTSVVDRFGSKRSILEREPSNQSNLRRRGRRSTWTYMHFDELLQETCNSLLGILPSLKRTRAVLPSNQLAFRLLCRRYFRRFSQLFFTGNIFTRQIRRRQRRFTFHNW